MGQLQGAVGPVGQTVPWLAALGTDVAAADAAISALPPTHGPAAVTRAEVLQGTLAALLPVATRRAQLSAQRGGLVAMDAARRNASVFNSTSQASILYVCAANNTVHIAWSWCSVAWRIVGSSTHTLTSPIPSTSTWIIPAGWWMARWRWSTVPRD